MRKKVFALGILACSLPVLAEPAYLSCAIKSEAGEERHFQVKLDESSGKVTHTWSDGSAFNTEGFFAANTITYQQIEFMSQGGIQVTYKYSIDRTNLAVSQEFLAELTDPALAEKHPSDPIYMKGNCDVVTVKDRKI